MIFVLRRLTACFSSPLRRLTAYFSSPVRKLTACFSSPLRRLTACFSAPFTLTISKQSSDLERKGAKNEIFTFSIVFRKDIYFTYQNFYQCDRVPLNKHTPYASQFFQLCPKGKLSSIVFLSSLPNLISEFQLFAILMSLES